MQDENIGFCTFPIFFQVLHQKKTIFPHLIKLLLIADEKTKFYNFYCGH